MCLCLRFFFLFFGFGFTMNIQIKMNFSSHCSSSSSSEWSSESVKCCSINWNWRSNADIPDILEAVTFLLVSVNGRLKGDDKSTDCDFHDLDGSSDELPLLKALRNLSTNRLWNLFKLPWLPTLTGFGGELVRTERVGFVGLVINEVCDVRELTRVNW